MNRNTLIAPLAACLLSQFPAQADCDGCGSAVAKMQIKAPPQVVWQAIELSRKRSKDLSGSRVVSSSGCESIIEQRMTPFPGVGTDVCLLKHLQVPYRRIDFQLLHAHRVKQLSGAWVLTPCAQGTLLELSTRIDTGLPIPRSVVDSFTSMKLRHRLQRVKDLAEAGNQAKL
jgi:hypothetical protein